MTLRRQWLVLGCSLAALTVAVVLIAGGVVSSRRGRELHFGLEQLDILMEDGSYSEASAMIPWLASRVRAATEGLRVLKRASAVFDSTGEVGPLREASRLLLEEFPGNASIRRVAVYAIVQAGDAEAALIVAEPDERAPDGDDIDAVLYAWTLLATTSPRTVESSEPFVQLTTLGRESAPEEFTRAWELTGDWRYAQLATLLMMQRDEHDGALALIERSGLAFHSPLLVAGILLDRGRYDEARSLLSRLPPTTTNLTRLADMEIYTGRFDQARSILHRLIDAQATPEAMVNLAWLATDRDERERILDEASQRFPENGTVVDQSIRHLAGADRDAAASRLADEDARFAGRELLALQLADRSPVAARADVWQLLETEPSQSARRYAAWLFRGMGARTDLAIVIERAQSALGASTAWVAFYRGVLQADSGDWNAAAGSFDAAFVAHPDWPAAHNAALALLITGSRDTALTRMRNALLLAEYAAEPDRVRVFLSAARITDDLVEARRLVERALEVNPSSSEALLLRNRLEIAGRR